MNNKNKILVGCLALLLVLSVGYAYFSDTITINGTATAKGEFDIIGSCQTGVPSGLVSGLEYVTGEAMATENGYKNDVCSFSDDEGTFSVEFEYPGAVRYFTIKLTNSGTIPAVMGEITDKDANICYDSDNSGDYDSSECSATNSSSTVWNYISLFSDLNIVGVQIGDGTIVPYDQITEEMAADFIDSDQNYMLMPGNSAYFVIETGINSLLGTNNGGEFMLSTVGTYVFPFTQITQ